MKDLPVSEYLQQVSGRNIRAGLQYEPRVWWDVFYWESMDGAIRTGHEVFYNAERYPVRVTHITAAALPVEPSGNVQLPEDDERNLHLFSMELESHAAPYPRGTTPIALLHNRANAAPPVAAAGAAKRRLRQPLVLGQRDVLMLRAKPERPLTNTDVRSHLFEASFVGVGMLSRRPVVLPVLLEFQANVPPFNQPNTPGAPNNGYGYQTGRVQNTLPEPVEIQEIIVAERFPAMDPAATAVPTFDVRNWRFAIEHRGNSSGEAWMKGPAPAQDNLMPAVLWGLDVGRAVVHELADTVPGPDGELPGWLIEPGETLHPRVGPAFNYGGMAQGTYSVAIALHGYAIIG